MGVTTEGKFVFNNGILSSQEFFLQSAYAVPLMSKPGNLKEIGDD